MMRYFAPGVLLVLAYCSVTGAVEEKSAKGQKTGEWKTLFDGKTLKNWEVAKGIDYEDKGKVAVKNGCLVLGTGKPATGVRWKGKFPKINYELALEGQRADGSDFFCGLSFPVGDGALTLILGGWGGWVVGLSCIDGDRAVDNSTCQGFEFKNKRWYKIRLRVTKERVKVWLDDNEIIDQEVADHEFTVTSEMEPCLPLGIATWETTGALRKIRYREIPAKKKLP